MGVDTQERQSRHVSGVQVQEVERGKEDEKGVEEMLMDSSMQRTLFDGMQIKRDENIGKRFGRLVPMHKVGKTKGRKYQYLCQCDCGKTSVVRIDYLRSGHTQSCGCFGIETKQGNGLDRSIDITGQVFGKLTAIKEAGQNRKGEFMYLFRCNECGREITRQGRSVRDRPDSKRCDCGEAARRKAEAELEKKNVINPRDDHAFAWDIYCCYIKDGMSLRDAAPLVGFNRGSTLTRLLLDHVPEYKEQSEKRRGNSRWAKQMEKTMYKSKLFRFEKDLRAHCVRSLSDRGIYCEENNKEMTGFEIDILTPEYCYELKVTTVKKDIYRALGQLSINASKSNLKPALVIPSDTRIHRDMLPILREHGIEVLSELTI